MSTVKKQTKEIWKSPPSLGIPWVEVSNLGGCRTTDHEIEYMRRWKTVKKVVFGKPKTIWPDKRGRPEVFFHFYPDGRNLKIKGRLLHSLVAECFLKGWRKGAQIYHLDGDIKNCRSDNLIVGSQEIKNKIQALKQCRLRIILKHENRKQIAFRGLVEAARFLGVKKQSVHAALKSGGRCKGYKVVSERIQEEERKSINGIAETLKKEL